MSVGAEERLAYLRKRFKEGDRFEATLVRYIGPQQAVIRIDGRGFVAWMHSSPPAGRRVCFVVDSLWPTVVLRESLTSQAGVNRYI